VRIESPSFTEQELRGFLDEVVSHERARLVDRLKAGSTRLAQLVARDPQRQGDGQPGWTGHEVLAHIAVLSKFYGVVTYQVASGKVSQVDLLHVVQDRDIAGEQLSSLPANQLLAMAQQDHRRTIGFLGSADATAMQRRAELYNGVSLSALEIASLALCAHLEIHLDQLERALQP
jgi:hypothetical protein